CVPSDDAAGTGCTSGGGKVCDGMGNCVACVGNGDCSTTHNCVSNMCVLTNGSTCTDGTQCQSTWCYVNPGPGKTCQPNSCGDTLKDGNETALDCGGGSFMGQPACPGCAPGKMCLVNADCASNKCPGIHVCM